LTTSNIDGIHKLKTISILIPTYNEEENIRPLYEALKQIFSSELAEYHYEIVIIDNHSTDATQTLITDICKKDASVKAIYNARNFGQFNSPYYGLCQTSGDCAILLCADFQDPLELIPVFVKEWESGYKIVSGIKTTSRENAVKYFFRSCYYKAIKRLSNIEQIEHFTGFGLYDKSFVDILRQLDDATPFLRGVVAELGFQRKDIAYEQQARKAGRTKNNWSTLYDAAMLSFTSYTKAGLRIATIMGFVCSMISLIISVVYLILKLLYWNEFPAGTTPVLIGVFFIGALQLFFVGLLGEYIISINARVMKRPLVIEEKRINFEQL